MLVLRQQSLAEKHGVFSAVTSASQICPGELSQRIKSSVADLSPLEHHHFYPKSDTEFPKMFHREFTTALYSRDEELRNHAAGLAIDQIQRVDEIRDLNHQLFILHHCQEDGQQSEIEGVIQTLLDSN